LPKRLALKSAVKSVFALAVMEKKRKVEDEGRNEEGVKGRKRG
jgi:hypothetical protein